MQFIARSAAVYALLATFVLATGGCNGSPIGVTPGLAGIPMPVSPYWQDEEEDKFWNRERYERVPILGPLTAGGPVVALDPPTPDEVMRALERARPVEGGIPLLWEKSRNNVRMTIEPLSDYVDPVRVYPLIGPAQLHHAHYKCTINYTEVVNNGWPLPYRRTDEQTTEVIYIDHNHFHMVGNVNQGPTPVGHP